MKLAIVSDLHIGYERFEADACAQAREALDAAKAQADAIIIPGDIFDRRAPKPEVIAQAINIFRDLANWEWSAKVAKHSGKGTYFTEVPVLAIPGTHERTAEGKENPLMLLALAGLLVDVSESTAIISKDDEKVAVFGLGGISEDRVRAVLNELAPKPVNELFSVFMFHQSIYELLPFDDNFLRYEDLPKGFDLYVDGHIHNRVEGTVHGKPFLIPGSTVLTQLKDGEQERKGFILFDTKSGSHKFVPINSRPFVAETLEFKNAGREEILKACEEAADRIIGASHTKPIIRLMIKGSMGHGVNISDLGLRGLSARYAQRAFLDIDYSRLESPELSKSIEELREGKSSGLSVKELGMSMLASKLKELKFDDTISMGALFDALDSDTAKKEKVIEAALRLIEESERKHGKSG